jgi:hypothetical protein
MLQGWAVNWRCRPLLDDWCVFRASASCGLSPSEWVIVGNCGQLWATGGCLAFVSLCKLRGLPYVKTGLRSALPDAGLALYFNFALPAAEPKSELRSCLVHNTFLFTEYLFELPDTQSDELSRQFGFLQVASHLQMEIFSPQLVLYWTGRTRHYSSCLLMRLLKICVLAVSHAEFHLGGARFNSSVPECTEYPEFFDIRRVYGQGRTWNEFESTKQGWFHRSMLPRAFNIYLEERHHVRRFYLHKVRVAHLLSSI